MLTDEELARRFQQCHDNTCFAEIFMRHRKKVFLACKGFFLDPQKAEDATQETFLRVYEKIRSFQDGDFTAWLMRVARNVCIDQWRKGRMDPVVENTDLAERVAVLNVESSFEIQERVERLWEAMKSLSPEQRTCLELKIEGCTYEETAARTGMATEAVKSHIQNGRRMLWKRLEGVLSESR